MGERFEVAGLRKSGGERDLHAAEAPEKLHKFIFIGTIVLSECLKRNLVTESEF